MCVVLVIMSVPMSVFLWVVVCVCVCVSVCVCICVFKAAPSVLGLCQMWLNAGSSPGERHKGLLHED